MLRIAETYLIRAEAYLALGEKSKAAADINVLRDRANASYCTAADIDIDYILDERARELLGEENRWISSLGSLSLFYSGQKEGKRHIARNSLSLI